MILIEDLSVQFEEKHVLKQLSLSIREGITTLIMGRSGIGKSVLLKCICGLIEAEEGRISIDGRSISGAPEKEKKAIRSKIGMLLQDGALFDGMTVFENIAFPLDYRGDESKAVIKQKVEKYAEIVGIEDALTMLPRELSGGMKRKTAIARAMITEPKYLLYDEPTTGLDPKSAGMVEVMIRRLCREMNITTVIASHDLALAEFTADEIALLEDGTITAVEKNGAAFQADSLISQSFITWRRRIQDRYGKTE
jgi:phospholipid/cholesterol/gamma-HCH transport system ATP-binding protein